MIASSIAVQSFPMMRLEDKAGFVLQNMEDFDVQELVVTKDDYFIGLVHKVDLLDIPNDQSIASIADSFQRVGVLGKAHITAVLDHFAKHQLSILPVLNEQQECLGVVPQKNLNEMLALYLGVAQPGAILVFSVSPYQYSLAEMSRIVESNNAQIVQLNSIFDEATGAYIITIKINKEEAQAIVSTFERYEYQLLHYFGNTPINNDIEDHYHHLMNYLDV